MLSDRPAIGMPDAFLPAAFIPSRLSDSTRGLLRRMRTTAVNQRQAPFARPPAPGWLSCELCERPASRPHRRLRLTLVRNNHDQPSSADDDKPDANRDRDHARQGSSASRNEVVPRKDTANLAMLVLLCSDCCALIVGAIDDDEWRRRIDASPANPAMPILSAPGA